MTKLTAAISWFVLLSAAPSLSADMIQGYTEPQAATRTAYVTRVEECTLLRIDYRSPYPSHTDLVNVCHPPLDMTPSGSRGSGGTTTISTQSFAVQ